MDRIAIAAYSSTCLGLADFLGDFIRASSEKFSFELRATGSSRTMLGMLQAGFGQPEDADVAMFTLPDAALHEVDRETIRLVETAQFSSVAIAPEGDFEGREEVDASWFEGRDIVTYGSGTAAETVLGGILGNFTAASNQAIHGVPDTVTINAVAMTGIAVGVAVGLTEPYHIAPGIKAVPIVPSSSSTRWRSYVAAREDRLHANRILENLFNELVRLDKAGSPGWLMADPTIGLHPYHQRFVKSLGKRLGATDVDVVRQALDLYKLAIDELSKHRLLTVTDPEEAVSYPIRLELMEGMERRPAS